MSRFEQFQQNVQRWATERGIYEHSTALAQALKAVSEVGELCDAVIKNDRDALIDAIGDTAVCLVNVGAMAGFTYQPGGGAPEAEVQQGAAALSWRVGSLAGTLNDTLRAYAPTDFDWAFDELRKFCAGCALDFDDCCESVWQTIKDRKGRMVAGGAFVKEGE